MPGFKKGQVTNPDYNSNANQFGEKTEFLDDVYVYGTLYADIDASDIDFTNVEFEDVNINRNLIVSGLSTFIGTSFHFDIETDYLTVFQRHNVGAAGTVFVAISSTSDLDGQVGGRVGIGTTQPDNRLQVGTGDTSFNVTDLGLVGIGTTQPVDKFQVGQGDNSAVITGIGTVGIGTTTVGGDWTIGNVQYDGSTQGDLKLDVDGSVHISRNIYDSAGSPGASGFFLNRDEVGIRWVSFEPSFTEGVFVQDEGQYIPLTGIAQSFTVFNFKQINSFGTGVDSLVPIPNPTNPTLIADIQTKDFWGFTGNDIYRMSKVGINNNSPNKELDVTGELHVTGNVDFDADLNVDGNAKIDQTLDVDGATTLNSSLDVDGDTTLNATLDVDGNTRLGAFLNVDGAASFNDTTDATAPLLASVHFHGGVGIQKKLIVGGQTEILDATDSTDKDTGALVVDGGVGIEKNLNVGLSAVIKGRLDVDDNTPSTNTASGAAVIDGGVGIALQLNVGQNTVIGGRLDVDDQTQSTSTTTGAAVIDGGVGIAKNLNVGEDAKITGDLELDKRIIDFFGNNGVGICKTDYRLSSFDTSGVGMGVSWRPSGVQTKRTIWVTKNGCDTNSGLLEGDAKYTIGAAAAIAQQGDTIRVRSGTYIENNPVGLRDDVAINGEDLRLVLLIPENKNRDFFHVRRGCLIENLSFTGANISDDHSNCGAVAFPPTAADVAAGFAFQAATGFTDLGPANEGSAGRWRSPYVRNCTNFMSKSIGMKINGDHANAAFTGTNDLGQDLKSMVCDSFTQYNEAGIGVSLSNNAYAQLVSIFTICSDIGIAATSGGQCDLTNSNSSFGRLGLMADGFGDIEFDGVTSTSTIGGSDRIISTNTQDQSNNNRTPFDGQGAYFHLNMNDYADSPSTATVTKPLELVRGLRVINGGNDGDYNAAAPPIISLVDSSGIPATPQGPESILPEFSPNVSAAGTITSVDVINSGRNFLPGQDLVVAISGEGNAQLEVDMDPILFTVSEATETSAVVGLSTVVFNEFIPYPIASGVVVEFVRLSRIITSSHSFEYIGAGTDINTANPFQAGAPIPENEVVAINGGQVPFTSTDQKGNFRIGDGLTIDQTTSTIRGRDFNRAIQAQLTPLILALN
tara:strand:- start:4498 stop:7905 length:3408 start_codon:yes stop_codon:yes gene_type:complete